MNEGSYRVEDDSVFEEFLRLLTGYWVSQAIHVVAELGIADLLKDAPKACHELANAVGAHEQSLYRVMRVLASHGIFREDDDHRFELTSLGEPLRSGTPGSMRSVAIVYGEQFYRAWGNLLHTVKTGETGFDSVFGQGLFEYYRANPAASELFNQAMTEYGRTMFPNKALIDAYDFSNHRTIVDVGGGHGDFLCDILDANPIVRGVLFDVSHVTKGTTTLVEQRGLSSRCEIVAGDFFREVAAGGDAYILKRIIHDWDDERAVLILKNCHRAMNQNGKVLIVETVIPRGNEPFFGKLLDLHMMMVTGGWERTAAQYSELFAASGFRLTRVFSTQSLLSLVEGTRI